MPDHKQEQPSDETQQLQVRKCYAHQVLNKYVPFQIPAYISPTMYALQHHWTRSYSIWAGHAFIYWCSLQRLLPNRDSSASLRLSLSLLAALRGLSHVAEIRILRELESYIALYRHTWCTILYYTAVVLACCYPLRLQQLLSILTRRFTSPVWPCRALFGGQNSMTYSRAMLSCHAFVSNAQ